MVPPERYVHAPDPVNVTLFEKRVFADVIKLRPQDKSVLDSGWALNLITSVLIGDRRREDTEKSMGTWRQRLE